MSCPHVVNTSHLSWQAPLELCYLAELSFKVCAEHALMEGYIGNTIIFQAYWAHYMIYVIHGHYVTIIPIIIKCCIKLKNHQHWSMYMSYA